jgi:hypothetical protein
MPDLDFQVTGVEAASRGLSPFLHFKVQVTGGKNEVVESLILQAQIQIQCAQRIYNPAEKEKLVEIFGTPERWGQTLRNKLWANVSATAGQFTGQTTVILPVPCSYDMNILGTKYFYALEGDEVPLLFLFSGTIFHSTEEGRLQVERISWNKECAYRMPVQAWKEIMEQHYPHSAWIPLQNTVFEEIYAYKRRMGLATWEEVIQRLLSQCEIVATAESHEPILGR